MTRYQVYRRKRGVSIADNKLYQFRWFKQQKVDVIAMNTPVNHKFIIFKH